MDNFAQKLDRENSSSRLGRNNHQNGGFHGGVCVWLCFYDADSLQAVRITGGMGNKISFYD